MLYLFIPTTLIIFLRESIISNFFLTVRMIWKIGVLKVFFLGYLLSTTLMMQTFQRLASYITLVNWGKQIWKASFNFVTYDIQNKKKNQIKSKERRKYQEGTKYQGDMQLITNWNKKHVILSIRLNELYKY